MVGKYKAFIKPISIFTHKSFEVFSKGKYYGPNTLFLKKINAE